MDVQPWSEALSFDALLHPTCRVASRMQAVIHDFS